MKERKFAGYLNSKSMYGQSYSSYEVLRCFKYNKILNLMTFKPNKWYKVWRYSNPSWGASLWNDSRYKQVLFTQRHYNNDIKSRRVKPKINFFPWKPMRIIDL